MGALVQEPQVSKREATQNMMDDSKKEKGAEAPNICVWRSVTPDGVQAGRETRLDAYHFTRKSPDVR